MLVGDDGRPIPWDGTKTDQPRIRISPWGYRQLFVDMRHVTEVLGDRDGSLHRPFASLPDAQQAVAQPERLWFVICDLRGRLLDFRDPPLICLPAGYELLQPGDTWQADLLVADWEDGTAWRYPRESDHPAGNVWEYSSPTIACRPTPRIRRG